MKRQDVPNPIVSNRRKRIPVHLETISVSLGEITAAACLQPLDVIKTRFQLHGATNYRGIKHCGATISQTEGVRALWKGFTPHAAKLSVQCALRFGSILHLESLYKSGKINSGLPLTCAFYTVRFVETFVIGTPFEVVKIRLQEQKGVKYKGAVQCCRSIIREEGVRVLWAGATPTLVRNVVNYIAGVKAHNALMSYVTLRERRAAYERKAFNSIPYLMLGLCTFVTAPVFSNPFDVIKTRLMVEGGKHKYKGMVHAMRIIYAEEGLLAFWRGTLPRLMWTPGLAIAWTVTYFVNGLYETSPNVNVQWKLK